MIIENDWTILNVQEAIIAEKALLTFRNWELVLRNIFICIQKIGVCVAIEYLPVHLPDTRSVFFGGFKQTDQDHSKDHFSLLSVYIQC